MRLRALSLPGSTRAVVPGALLCEAASARGSGPPLTRAAATADNLNEVLCPAEGILLVGLPPTS